MSWFGLRLSSRGALPLGAITGGMLATLLAARPAIAILMALMLVVPVLLRRSPLGRSGASPSSHLAMASPPSDPPPHGVPSGW